jgi:DNA invertase Pin-like site-specific DNA recombinase
MITSDKQRVPAVAYYRMSTDRQDKSIDGQRVEVERYASKHGYVIIREYLDEAISGDNTEKRIAFQRMIADAADRGDFQAILCWDQDRFGRFNSLEAGYWIHPLIKRGVILATVAQGAIDWNDFTGRVMYAIQQEGKNQFLRDLARNSLRGAIARAKTGQWPGGAPPYGFEVGLDGHLVFGEQSEVATVRSIFRMRLEGMGYRTISNQLNKLGIKGPSGGKWSHDGVRIILWREAYCGTITLGGRRQGKYFTTDDGEPTPVSAGKRRAVKSIRVENAHPGIIDRKTFEAVLAARAEYLKPHWRNDSEGAPLAGLLRCGRCGGPMYAQSMQRKAGQKSPNYICGTYKKGHGCGYCSVGQKALLLAVARIIRERVLMGSVEALEAAIAKQLKSRQAIVAAVDPSLPKRLRELDRKIENATDRLVSVDPALVPTVEKKLLALQLERSQLIGQQKAARGPTRNADDPKRIAAGIWQLDAILAKGSPSKVRAALSRIVASVVLDFKPGKKTGRGQAFDFSKGTIELHTQQCASRARGR